MFVSTDLTKVSRLPYVLFPKEELLFMSSMASILLTEVFISPKYCFNWSMGSEVALGTPVIDKLP